MPPVIFRSAERIPRIPTALAFSSAHIAQRSAQSTKKRAEASKAAISSLRAFFSLSLHFAGNVCVFAVWRSVLPLLHRSKFALPSEAWGGPPYYHGGGLAQSMCPLHGRLCVEKSWIRPKWRGRAGDKDSTRRRRRRHLLEMGAALDSTAVAGRWIAEEKG